MPVAEEIRRKLEESLAPDELEVSDESEAHRGHAGYREGGESHFHVTIRSETLTGMTRLARHRAVHKAIGDEIMGRIHALALTIKD